tara:strand:+ start:297 stop:1493 length:1197 start_codon:yes stop_codon:yes gene_type:complete
MRTKTLILNFVLVFVSTSAALLSICLVLELILPNRQLKIATIERKRSLEVDYPAKIKSAANRFFPLFYPYHTRKHFLGSRYYPIGTLPHTQSFYCNEGYGLISFKSDRFGLRNNDEDWDEIRNKGATFFVGDSFTQGACVDTEFVVTEIFSNALNANALNLGTGSNGPYEYIALLKNVVKPIISSHLGKEISTILVFYDNDNVRFNETLDRHLSTSQPIVEVNPNGFINVSKEYLSILNETITRHYPTNSRDILEELKSNQQSPTKFKGSFAYRVLTLYQLRLRFKKIINTEKPLLSTNPNPSIKAISELHSICNSETLCTPYVAYIPNSTYWRPNDASNEYKLLLEKTSRKLSIKFLDSSSIINQNEKSNYAPIGPHLSQEGYKKLANFIASQVNQK